MPSHKRVATPDDPARALVKGIAMDIGKEKLRKRANMTQSGN